MKLTEGKSLLEQVTIEQFRQNIVLLQAKEIEIPRAWVLELVNTIQSLQVENEQLRCENEKPNCQDCAVQAFEVACILQDYKEKNEHLQAQVGKAIEVLTEWETLIVSGQFKHDRCTNNLIHEALSFLKAGEHIETDKGAIC